MTLPRPGSQIKYELLEKNKRTAVKSSHLWLAVLMVVLVVCTTIIAFYLTWQSMLNATKKNESLDFIMIGPSKSFAGTSQISHERGKLYGLAVQYMDREGNWSQLQLSFVPGHMEPQEYKRVCYYNLPSSTYQHLNPDMIPPDLCTHINIAFATVTNGTLQPCSPSDIQSYRAITALKEKNTKLKVLLSVEWFTSEGEFAWAVSSSENRTRFVDEAVRFLRANNFDGLDVDWEFPSWPTVVQNQTNCFTELLRLLYERLHEGESPLLLSVAAGAPKPIIDNSYNITAMAQYIDYVNVMAYDYHMYQAYLPLTGPNAPLYQRQSEKGYFTTLNLNWTAAYWVYKGMPAHKVVVGVPTYGHSFMLVNEANHGWEAPSSGVGSVGSGGFVAYYDVCAFMDRPEVKNVFDFENKVPYAFLGKEWISYENEQSVAYKAEFAKKHQFGGVMIYSLNTDDIEGVCGGATKFPLSERIKNVLQDDQL